MTERIAFFEDVLRLEPNSKLFFPLAQAYMQDHRPQEALAVLRKGLAFHPEHLEARLLLIDCLSQRETTDPEDRADVPAPPSSAMITPAPSPELASLTASLAAHPVFWKQWAARSRAEGRTDLAVTLDMLALQFSGGAPTWGALLDQGLRTVTAQGGAPQASGLVEPAPEEPDPPPAQPEATVLPEPGLKSDSPEDALILEPAEASWSALPGRESAPESTEHLEPEGLDDPEEEILELLVADEPTSAPQEVSGDASAEVLEAAPDALAAKPQPLEQPGIAEISPDAQLTEGERRYYETRTYAELLAKQGENDEALELYAKLLQSSPDQDQRRELQSRMREIRERIARMPRETGTTGMEPRPAALDPLAAPGTALDGSPRQPLDADVAADASGPTPNPAKQIQTLNKLAKRLESRAEAENIPGGGFAPQDNWSDLKS